MDIVAVLQNSQFGQKLIEDVRVNKWKGVIVVQLKNCSVKDLNKLVTLISWEGGW